MQIENILDQYQLVPLTFAQSQLAASQTAVALYPIETATPHVLLNLGYTMPFAGFVVAVSVNLNAAATAGSLTVTPTIDTTVVTTPVATLTTAAYGVATCQRSKNGFAKNAVIGCKITTGGTWNGTTRDLQVIVWVLMKITGV
jgi:hypothetical protein